MRFTFLIGGTIFPLISDESQYVSYKIQTNVNPKKVNDFIFNNITYNILILCYL